MAEEQKQEQKVSTPEEISTYMEQSLSGGNVEVPVPVIEQKAEESQNKPTDDKKDESGTQVPKPEESGTEAPKTDQNTYNPIWDNIVANKKAEGSEFEIPETVKTGKLEDGTDLTPEKEYELISQAMQKKGIEEDEFIKNYKEAAKKEDFDKDKWLDGKTKFNDIFKKSSKEFIKFILENQKNGEGEKKYNEEEINEYIDAKNKIDLDREADVYKQQYKEAQEQQEENINLKKTNEQKQIQDNFIENRDKEISNLISEVSNVNEVGGLPHSEAERKEFEPIFKKLMGYDKKTNKLAIEDFFSGGDTEGSAIQQTKVGNRRLYEALFAYFQGKDGNTEKYLSKYKEEFKQKVLDKTDTAPRKTEGKVSIEHIPDKDTFVV